MTASNGELDSQRPKKTKKGRVARNEIMRTALLEKAAAIFAEKGFVQTSIQDLADGMNVSRSAIYYYFSGKEEILDALAEDSTLEAANKILLPPDVEGADYRLLLKDSIRELVIYVASKINIFQTLNISAAQLPPSTAERYLQGKDRVLQRLVQIIEGGMKSGQFRKVDSHIAALGIGGMASIFATQHFPEEFTSAPEEMANTLADMAVASIANSTDREELGAREVCNRIRKEVSLLEDILENLPEK